MYLAKLSTRGLFPLSSFRGWKNIESLSEVLRCSFCEEEGCDSIWTAVKEASVSVPPNERSVSLSTEDLFWIKITDQIPTIQFAHPNRKFPFDIFFGLFQFFLLLFFIVAKLCPPLFLVLLFAVCSDVNPFPFLFFLGHFRGRVQSAQGGLIEQIKILQCWKWLNLGNILLCYQRKPLLEDSKSLDATLFVWNK